MRRIVKAMSIESVIDRAVKRIVSQWNEYATSEDAKSTVANKIARAIHHPLNNCIAVYRDGRLIYYDDVEKSWFLAKPIIEGISLRLIKDWPVNDKRWGKGHRAYVEEFLVRYVNHDIDISDVHLNESGVFYVDYEVARKGV